MLRRKEKMDSKIEGKVKRDAIFIILIEYTVYNIHTYEFIIHIYLSFKHFFFKYTKKGYEIFRN